jgi:alpha/beta superfamily hydrolase
VGPFASERHNSYNAWARWARYLAEQHVEVTRFDYRGIGESTGVFETMTFKHWEEDVRLVADWLTNQSPKVPFVLHGLEIGALFAAKAFEDGVGDALILWSPPSNANQALRVTLRRWVGLEQLLKFSEDRKTTSDWIRTLESGSPIEVEGYVWSTQLWRDSFDLALPVALIDMETAAERFHKPIKIEVLTADAAPLAKKGMIGGGEEINDLGWLYSSTFEWLNAALATCCGGRNEYCG